MRWVLFVLEKLGILALAFGVVMTASPFPYATIVREGEDKAYVLVQHTSRWLGLGLALLGAALLVGLWRLRKRLKSRVTPPAPSAASR